MNHFFQNKTVLITGHTGFKGSWLSLWLTKLGANVVGFALKPPTQPNLFTLARVADQMTSIIGDIRDFNSVLNVIKTYKPEIVIHMAAQPLVLYSYIQPVETYATNVLGTVHLLDAIRQIGCTKTIVNVTTDKCYDNKESYTTAYNETDSLGGYDPYSNSKACSELVTSAYKNSYFKNSDIGLASARAGNVIGGGDWAENRLIPDIIRSCINKEPVCIRHPHAIRPWQHVLEPLSGYLRLTELLHNNPTKFSEAWNLGPDIQDVQPVSWICEYITQHWHKDASWFIDKNAIQHHEATFLSLDCSKAKDRLNWQPRWNLSTALNETINWYKAYQAKEDLNQFTMQQISKFMTYSEKDVYA